MRITEKGTKEFTKKEKLAIIKEAGEKGVKVTPDKYDIYSATYYYWKLENHCIMKIIYPFVKT